MQKQGLTIGDVSRLLGIPIWRIVYAQEKGDIGKQRKRRFQHLWYSEVDVERMAEYFEVEKSGPKK